MVKDNRPPRMPDVVMEGVQIRSRNFSGKEGQYNVKGQRNFLVLLDDDVADAMAEDGWNIKEFKVREEDEGDTPQKFLKVKVNMQSDFPPRVVLVTSHNKTQLQEEDLNILDWTNLINVDMIINPSPFDFNGKTGYTAYLKSGFFTIEEDQLDLKYADVPDSAQNSVMSRDISNESEPF